ncbi:unnamed protein product, partial [Mesorhabditis belari]|uniref:Uncharacterized protein n=1 Tax=Mesorhabditis belari TaxID=2138241 RepID=A0AAF3F9G1_9BILA
MRGDELKCIKVRCVGPVQVGEYLVAFVGNDQNGFPVYCEVIFRVMKGGASVSPVKAAAAGFLLSFF